MPPVPEQIWSQQANPPHSDCLPIIDKLTVVDGMNHFWDYMSSKENVLDSLRDLKGSLFSCPSLPVACQICILNKHFGQLFSEKLAVVQNRNETEICESSSRYCIICFVPCLPQKPHSLRRSPNVSAIQNIEDVCMWLTPTPATQRPQGYRDQVSGYWTYSHHHIPIT